MTARERSMTCFTAIADYVESSRRLEATKVIERAINAAVEEVEDRVANERKSYLERIEGLEKENAMLRARLEFLSPTVRTGLND